MMQNLYDERYVDTVELVKVAQRYGIDTGPIGAAGTQDELWEARNAVHERAREADPTFCDSEATLKLLRQLDDRETAEELEDQLSACDSPDDFARWASSAGEVLGSAKAAARKLYGGY